MEWLDSDTDSSDSSLHSDTDSSDSSLHSETDSSDSSLDSDTDTDSDSGLRPMDALAVNLPDTRIDALSGRRAAVVVPLGGLRYSAPRIECGVGIELVNDNAQTIIASISRTLDRVRFLMAIHSNPVLALIPRDDSVWRYNYESNATFLACSPEKAVSLLHSKFPKFDQTVKCLEIIRELLRENRTATKRDIYYRHVRLFKSQASVDYIVESIACSLGVHRHSLNLTASPKGLTRGPFKIHVQKELGVDNEGEPDPIRVISARETTILIPATETIVAIEFTPRSRLKSAIQVLVVEKEASFSGLCGEMNTRSEEHAGSFDWILITGKGYPDKNTQMFVHLLSNAKFVQESMQDGSIRYIWNRVTPNPSPIFEVMEQQSLDSHLVPDLFGDDSDDDTFEAYSSTCKDTFDMQDDSDMDWTMAEATYERYLMAQSSDSENDVVVPSFAGQPTMGTRIHGLFDCDPHGIDILLCYKFGSKKNAYESPYTAVPSMKWAGVTMKDVLVDHCTQFFDSNQTVAPRKGEVMYLDQAERKKILMLLKRVDEMRHHHVGSLDDAGLSFIRTELQRMMFSGIKVEIQGFSISYLLTPYLVEKLA
ncbi:endodeoxyribonuclease [Chytriomyces hyalinus]|nr:endodeoxyribonuclease [Chytriomyces hyalinus]